MHCFAPYVKYIIPELKMDADVAAVVHYMQTTLPATKLVSVAQAVSDLAPLLWRRYDQEAVLPLELLASSDLVECKPASAKG